LADRRAARLPQPGTGWHSEICRVPPPRRSSKMMRRLPPPIHGIILDHLQFSDALSATTTDRAGRKALGYVRSVLNMKYNARAAPMLNQLVLCEDLQVIVNSTSVVAQLARPLESLRHLRALVIRFSADADMTQWSQSCESLTRSVLGQLQYFDIVTVKNHLFHQDPFRSLLFRLPADYALIYALRFPNLPAYIIPELLARGADPNKVSVVPKSCPIATYIPYTPLEIACEFQDISVIRSLLDSGARSPDRSDGDRDAFMQAFDRNNPYLLGSTVDVIRLLYESGLRSWYRERGPVGYGSNILHHLMFSSSSHLSVETCVATAKLVCENQPELLMQKSQKTMQSRTYSFTPYEIMTARWECGVLRTSSSAADQEAFFEQISSIFEAYLCCEDADRAPST